VTRDTNDRNLPVRLQDPLLQIEPASEQTSNEREEAEFLTEAEIRRRECENIFVVLQKTGWKIKGTDGAARLLGVKPTTLISRMKRMGLVRPV
jgi:transcriptional regulator with GAF, ATPase, and Fis domain